MPAPAYIVAASLTAAAATFVFVRFIYEPHIAPALERLAEDFLERRRAAQREREERERHLADPVQEIPLDTRTSARAPPSSATRRPGPRPGSGSGSGSSPTVAGDGDNTGERTAPRRAPAPSGTGTGTGVGRTPEEVNEWRNAISHRSLRQRRSRIAPAQPGNDTPRNTFGNADDITANVWSGSSAVSSPSHVLDEPNHPIPHQPLRPTAPRGPQLSTSPSLTLSGSNTPGYPTEEQRQRNYQRHFSDDLPIPNRASNSFIDSYISVSPPSTLGLGLGPVFTVGEIDESVHGSSPSTQRGDYLPDETVDEERGGSILRPIVKVPLSLVSALPPTLHDQADHPALLNPFEPSPPPPNLTSNPNSGPTPPAEQLILSLSQSYPISLDHEQGIELVSNPSESEPEPSEFAFGGSEFGASASPDRPSSPESAATGGPGSPFIQLSPPQLPVVMPAEGGAFDYGSVPTIRQVLERTERQTRSPPSPPSPTMFHSFTDDHASSRQNAAQARHTPDILSPTLSELEFSSEDGYTSPFASNDEFGSESSWMSARV
ncbi:hypothetical protein AX14_007057 [Amanita brunnescens Koide BX004]|nr:hypothetical protein AX14_007057 [Amanita brunnescens Koide BX004]